MPPPPGPPYPPTNQDLGGVPSTLPDVPLCAIFLLLFAAGGSAHMALFFRNKSRQHKFVFNALCFGFCMSRLVATSLRIAWSRFPTNVGLGIAAQVFVNVGIIMLFIVNLFLTSRLLRARHPRVGWSGPGVWFLRGLVVVVVLAIPCLIASILVQFYSAPGNTPSFAQRSARDIQRFGTTVEAGVAVVPVPVLILGLLVPRGGCRKSGSGEKGDIVVPPPERFGSGSWAVKYALVLGPAVFLTLGASLRAATTYLIPTPLEAPQPWYLSKASFYVFNFGIEVGVIYLWLVGRIDQRFHVPNGAKGTYLGYKDEARSDSDRLSTFEILPDGRWSKGSWTGSGDGDSEWKTSEEEEDTAVGKDATTMAHVQKPGLARVIGWGRVKKPPKSECALCSGLFDAKR